MVNWEETDAGPGRGVHGAGEGDRPTGSHGLRRAQASPEMETNNSEPLHTLPIVQVPHSDPGSLVPKAPGLGSQVVAFSQAELERVLSRWFV